MPIGSQVIYNSGDLILSTVSSSNNTFVETKISAATSSLIYFDNTARINSASLSSITVGNAVSSSYALTASFALNSGGGSGTVSGSTNYIGKFISSTVIGTSSIYETGSNVGIGTTDPQYKLDVSPLGSNARVGILELGSWPAGSTYAYLQHSGLSSLNPNNYAFLQESTGETFFNAAPGQVLHFRIGNVETAQFNSSGYLGIGHNNNPITAKLEVSGSGTDKLFNIKSTNAGDYILFVSGSGRVGIGTNVLTNKLTIAGNVTASSYTSSIINAVGFLGTASCALTASAVSVVPSNVFVQGGNSFGTTATLGTNDASALIFETNNTGRVTIDTNGYFGIAQPTPTAYLHVGQNTVSDTNNYGIRIDKNGTLGSPGSYQNSAIYISDLASDGPSTVDITGQVSFNFPRLQSSDTSASKVSHLIISHDSALGPMRVDGKGNLWVGYDRSLANTSSNSFSTLIYGGLTVGSNYQTTTVSDGTAIFAGNVGIGTYNPQFLLDVSGSSRHGAIPSNVHQFTGSININGSLFSNANITASNISASGTGSFGIIGIGTTSPSAKLTIVDNTNGGTIHLVGRTSDDTAAINFRATGDASTYAYIAPDTNEFRMYHNDGFMSFYPGGNEKVRITSAGNLGIGITTPSYKLDVSGSINATSNPGASGAIIRVRDMVTAGNESFSGVFFSSNPGTDYTIGKWTTTNQQGFLQIRDQSGNKFFTLNSSGQVGIGTDSPSFLIDVSGSSRHGYRSADVHQFTGSVSLSDGLSLTNLTASNISASGNIIASKITASNAFINGNLTVTGSIFASLFSASYIYITSSTLVVTDNIITLNALSPYQRYAGIEMYDSGSGNLSSFLWDGQGDYFFVTGSGVNSKIIVGPDQQTNLTSGRLTKATGTNIIGDSIVSDNGSGIIVSGYISGSSVITGNITASNISASGTSSFGYVGIGTNAPIYKLDLQNTSSTARLGNAIVGAWPVNNTFALFGHNNLDHATSATNYALIQWNDGTTYLNASSGKPINFRIANADKMILDANGNVGIGTTSPGALLAVNGDSFFASKITIKGSAAGSLGNSSGLQLYQDTSTDTSYLYNFYAGAMVFGTNNVERMRILSGGNVGIGTTSPAFLLDVSGSSRHGFTSTNTHQFTGSVNISGSTNTSNVTTTTQVGGTSGTFLSYVNPGIYATGTSTGNAIGIFSNTTFANQGAIANLGLHQVTSNAITSNANDLTAGVYLAVGGWYQNSGTGIPVYIGGGYTSNSSSVLSVVPSDASGNGNVGIGTRSPLAPLHVGLGGDWPSTTGTSAMVFIKQNTSNAGLIIQEPGDASSDKVLHLYTNGSLATIEGTYRDTGPYPHLAFKTSGTERMRITSDGNVGIGTTSPAYKLHVVGDGYFTGNVTIGLTSNYSNLNFIRNGGASVGGIGWRSDGYFYVGGHPDYGPVAGNDVRVRGFGSSLILGTNSTDYVYLNSVGNVGIGITSPTARLDVKSQINLTNSITQEMIAVYLKVLVTEIHRQLF